MGEVGFKAPVQARWRYQLEAEFGHRNITPDLARLVRDSGVTTGIVAVQLVGSTGAITTIEYERGVLQDFRRILDRLVPTEEDYAHNLAYGDGNGFSHIRSALLKTSLAIPVIDRKLALGTWQQVVVINLDNRPREREVVAVVVGS